MIIQADVPKNAKKTNNKPIIIFFGEEALIGIIAGCIITHTGILSETFALCGHNVSFAELKGIYEWQMVHGINLL